VLIAHEHQVRQLGGQIVGGNMSRRFLGAVVNRSGELDQVVPVGMTATLSWVPGAYDIGGWFDPGSPTIFTVPAGVTRVRHWYNIFFTGTFNTSGSNVRIEPFLNGFLVVAFGQILYVPETGVFNSWNQSSPSYSVSEGFELDIRFTAVAADASVDVFGTIDTSFGIEAVAMEY